MARSLVELDKNFKSEAVDIENIEFYNAKEKPFKIYGLYNSESRDDYVRIPDEISKNISEGVQYLSHNTSGGRLRFKTDSDVIAVSIECNEFCAMPHMTIIGSSCFDMYEKKDDKYYYLGSFRPDWGLEAIQTILDNHKFTSVVTLESKKMRDITINFPLYSSFEKLYIGVLKESQLLPGEEYRNELPIVYYGSSITQGGCASRPGNNYSNILSRWYDIDFYNFGFSGNAKGEKKIAKFLADYEMSAFVYAYDHNAPSVEHLKNTHEAMYKIIREKHSEVPIILITRPKTCYTDEEKQRRNVVLTTYDNAKARGENVYFIDGEKIGDILGGDSITVDGCHPNDLGFMCIAAAVDKILKSCYHK